MREYERKADNSVMYKRVKQEHVHEENNVQFQIKVVGRFRSAMN